MILRTPVTKCLNTHIVLYTHSQTWPLSRPKLTTITLHTPINNKNQQVPSLSLQRVRLRLDYLAALDDDTPPFLTPASTGGSYVIDASAAAAFVRAAERDGVMGGVTALGGLRLEAEEDRARQEKERSERGRGRWSSSDARVSGGLGDGGGGGLWGSLASWFTGGGGKKKA